MFEWTLPARCMISNLGAYAENTAPQAASLRFEFSYVLAHCNVE